MQDLPAATIEGKLIAQRRMIAELLALVVLGDEPREALAERLLHVSFLPLDQQEDPGAVPDPAHGVQGAMAEEMRLIAEEARRLVAERRGTPDASLPG